MKIMKKYLQTADITSRSSAEQEQPRVIYFVRSLFNSLITLISDI